MRYNMDARAVQEIMMHPYYQKMMKFITDQMIREEQLWRRYRPHKLIRDTETTKRRIQTGVSHTFMESALKYSKRPWTYIGRNKIKTRFYDELDWVENPFDVLEEKTEQNVKQQQVKTSK